MTLIDSSLFVPFSFLNKVNYFVLRLHRFFSLVIYRDLFFFFFLKLTITVTDMQCVAGIVIHNRSSARSCCAPVPSSQSGMESSFAQAL